MKMYDVIKLDNSEYNGLVIMCNANPPANYLLEVWEELREKNIVGKVLIDEILHVGNTNKRFLSFYIDDNLMLEDITPCFEDIKKGNNLRKISCEYLRKNDLIKYSILSSVQKRMMDRGIAI